MDYIGANVDDLATLLRFHHGHSCLGACERSQVIDVQNVMPIVHGEVFNRFAGQCRKKGGVIDQNVDSAELGHSRVDQSAGVVRGADVGLHEDRLLVRADEILDILTGIVHVGERDRGALGGYATSVGESQSGRRSGNDDNLLTQKNDSTP